MGSFLLRVGQTFTIVLLAVLAAALGAAFLPTLLGYEHLVVTSGSMGSAMPVGSVAVNRMVDNRAVGVGDVVTFHPPGGSRSVTHRIIEVRTEHGRRILSTKGDANRVPDPEPVILEERIARLAWTVPYAGFVVGFARSPAGAILLIVVPLVGLLADRGGRSKNRRKPSRRDAPLPGPGRLAAD